MASSKLHHSLPDPVVHAGFIAPHSKSHVVAGVQDAYWSDDEANQEDADCPLCLEEMDISDLNFKPCVCGYQICRFCWHHIKENLNKRCPACRRVYTDEAVEFKPIATQDHKRLTQQKKQREKERKELDALGRRHLVNVRVVQRSVVYVVGIGSRFAKEELIPTLRSNEYFGQYGKITKMVIVKRTPSGGGTPVVGLYITYHRREDAARAIAAVDGSPSPGGGIDLMRASYGTTKYCMAFLRGVACNDNSCMNLHEWGDEKDCFTKEDLTTLKHTMKVTETRPRTTSFKKTDDSDASSPRAASWALKGTTTPLGQSTLNGAVSNAQSSASRQSRRGPSSRQTRNMSVVTQVTTNEGKQLKGIHERKSTAVQSQPSSSRPSTPSSTISASHATPFRSMRQKMESLSLRSADSPASSITAHSDVEYTQEGSMPKSSHQIPPNTPVANDLTVSTSMPAIPPGLSTPGILITSRPSRTVSASPQTPFLTYQSYYQMSNAARALLDDVKARRESALPPSEAVSPFPDFDRTLQTLSGEFSFNLDPKVADELDSEGIPFHGSYGKPLPSLSAPVAMGPPGLTYSPNVDRYTSSLHTPANPVDPLTSSSSYVGSFNPFADTSMEIGDATPSSPIRWSTQSPLDEERKVSRFVFARGRQGVMPLTSPTHVVSAGEGAVYNGNAMRMSPQSKKPAVGFSHGASSIDVSLTHSIPRSGPHEPFQPFDTEVSEAQLRDLIQSSRRRVSIPDVQLTCTGHLHRNNLCTSTEPFSDPAVMSASFGSSTPNPFSQPMNFGPPPGLSLPSIPSQAMQQTIFRDNKGTTTSDAQNSSQASTTDSVTPYPLSHLDFPALKASVSEGYTTPYSGFSSTQARVAGKCDSGILNRKASKKKAATEHERQVIQAKAKEKVAERARHAQEKVVGASNSSMHREPFLKRVSKTEKHQITEEVPAREAQAPMGSPSPVVQPPLTQKVPTTKSERPAATRKATSALQVTETKQAVNLPPSPVLQVPLLSRKPKKSKPVIKVRVVRDEEIPQDDILAVPVISPSDNCQLPVPSSADDSRAPSPERIGPATVEALLSVIHFSNPQLDLANHPLFDVRKVNAVVKMPLEYGPLVHALSALSVGGGSFANNMPSGSIDNAVSSFQQLLETLTQTISDLLRLLPRTTWDDSSSFDSVLRDMLKGDDFLDDGGDDGQGKGDEVAALTLALERRARWMEVQLSKLEELHRDINTAAVRAVLSFSDNGWDKHLFLPRVGNTLRRFDELGVKETDGQRYTLPLDELEKALVVEKDGAVHAEAEFCAILDKWQGIMFEPLF